MTMRCGDCGEATTVPSDGAHELIRVTRGFLDGHKNCHLSVTVELSVPVQLRAEL
jgi:hypothetical protein